MQSISSGLNYYFLGNLSLSVFIKCALAKKRYTEKQHTINHMIIFNDSISKFTSAAFQVFAEACFLVSASAKKAKN